MTAGTARDVEAVTAAIYGRRSQGIRCSGMTLGGFWQWE
jgi:hypothetical protein